MKINYWNNPLRSMPVDKGKLLMSGKGDWVKGNWTNKPTVRSFISMLARWSLAIFFLFIFLILLELNIRNGFFSNNSFNILFLLISGLMLFLVVGFSTVAKPSFYEKCIELPLGTIFSAPMFTSILPMGRVLIPYEKIKESSITVLGHKMSDRGYNSTGELKVVLNDGDIIETQIQGQFNYTLDGFLYNMLKDKHKGTKNKPYMIDLTGKMS